MAPKAKPINLALQGGGAHGAFTWGVLDALLDTPEIEIAAISGTSAGALNGAAIKAGLSQDSRDLARDNLEWLWEQVGAITDQRFAPWLNATSPSAISALIETSLPFAISDSVSRMVSPYSYGPFYQNPLRRIVEQLHYEDICCAAGPEFHICATNVRSGKIRIFDGDDITPEAIMASACLPTMFQAVEIIDPATGRLEAYWDGGYTGNPALFPLFHNGLPSDILVVNINPLHREDVPTSARAIQNRINEISFNTSLLRELRAIHFVQRLLSNGHLSPGAMKHVLVHMVADDALMAQLSVATKLVATPQVLHQLRAAGRAACEGFLETHFDRIGQESTVDLVEMFG
ncbi:patatin-like phospholipase family protein [Rhodophyticola sp.]|jgi:NTE family protein|uniref:patatin-like phospholipase family protein n=1 Tax=Rhodophyticola sp. TaxID=2680032 RepID=UPI001B15C62C|nr:patatin-like phospholipase family protein [Roseicyclus sp.]MBO6625728.1 patatin-like phospholipase family protein [Roseicyclus sp.]MBO6922395.1 patatin-like phospholipase family protein [Roseicyclus sp.]